MSSYSSQTSSDVDRSSRRVDAQTGDAALALGENQQNLTDGGAGRTSLLASGAWGNLAALEILPDLGEETLDFLGGITSGAAQMGLSVDNDAGTVSLSSSATPAAVDDRILLRAAEKAAREADGEGLERVTAENDIAALTRPDISDAERAEIAERYGLTPSDTASLQLSGDGSITFNTTQQTPTLNEAGEAAVEAVPSSVGVQLGEGVAVSANQSHTSAEGVTTARSAGFGVIAREDGEYGVSASAGGSEALPGSSTVVGATTAREITSRGTSQTTTREISGPDGQQASLMTRGGVKVWTKQQADGTYLLTCSVEVGGALSGQSDADKTVEGSVRAGASLVYTHILTESEVGRYLSDVEAALDGNVAQGGPAELGMIASLGLMNDQGTDPLLAVGDASAAAGLAMGDTLTLTSSVGASVGGHTSSGPVSIGGAAALDCSRTCTIARTTDPKTGAPRVAISITFTDARSLEGNANLTPGGGAVGGGGAVVDQTSDGLGRRFLLDPDAPDYDEHYGEIVGAMTRDQLDGVAAHIQAESTTKTSLLGRMVEASLSFFGITLTASSARETSEDITDSRTEGLSGTVSGKRTDAARVDVLGAEMAGRAEEGAVTGTLQDGAATVDLSLTDEQRTLLLAAGAETGAPAASGGLWSTLVGLFTKPKGQGIVDALTELQRAVSVLRLGPGDLETVIARAGDRAGWLAVADAQVAVRELTPWMQLRSRLVSPAPAEDYPDAAVAERVLLSRLRALARFAGETGQAGVQLLTGVAREWQGEGSQQDVGTMAMFPDSLSGERDAYYAFLGTVDEAIRVEDRVPTLAADEIHRLLLEGGRLKVAVASCTAFGSARAKMEMLDALTARMDRLHLATLQAEGECTGAGEIQTQQREIARLEALLGGCKREERTLLASVGGTPVGQREMAILGDRLDQVRDIYEHWLSQIRRLRGAYDALEQIIMADVEGGGDVTLLPLRVISTPGAARNPELEPEAEGYFAAREALNKGSLCPGLQPEDKDLQRRLAAY